MSALHILLSPNFRPCENSKFPYINVDVFPIRIFDGGIVTLDKDSLDELHYRHQHQLLSREFVGILVKQLFPTPPEPRTAMWYSRWYPERPDMTPESANQWRYPRMYRALYPESYASSCSGLLYKRPKASAVVGRTAGEEMGRAGKQADDLAWYRKVHSGSCVQDAPPDVDKQGLLWWMVFRSHGVETEWRRRMIGRKTGEVMGEG